jgi:hypothetical protein
MAGFAAVKLTGYCYIALRMKQADRPGAYSRRVAVVLRPDVAAVFDFSKMMNNLLRSAVSSVAQIPDNDLTSFVHRSCSRRFE